MLLNGKTTFGNFRKLVIKYKPICNICSKQKYKWKTIHNCMVFE